MAGDITLRKPQEMEIFSESGELISPPQLFTNFYSGLNELIRYNQRSYSNRLDIDPEVANGHKEAAIRLKSQWDDAVSKQTLHARLRFDDLSEKKYQIVPRTNFEPHGIFKFPNIAYLRDGAGNTVVLREARVHPKEIAYKRLRSFFNNNFDAKASDVFYDSGAPKVLPPNHRAGVMYMPEPQLLVAMEKMYEELKIPRVTPDFRVVGEDERNLWYLRDWQPVASDLRLSLENMAKYTGVLHTMGLMELVDARQLVHYYATPAGEIGNYDFDFIAHSSCPQLISQREMTDVSRVITSEGKLHNIFNQPREFAHDLNRLVGKAVQEYSAQGINNKTIFGFIKPKIETEGLDKTKFGTLY